MSQVAGRLSIQAGAHPLEKAHVCKGQVTYKAVADELGYEYVDPVTTLSG
jgi:alanine dehydrogenase